jgi:hypothetical protein
MAMSVVTTRGLRCEVLRMPCSSNSSKIGSRKLLLLLVVLVVVLVVVVLAELP